MLPLFPFIPKGALTHHLVVAKSAWLRFRLWRKLCPLPCSSSPHKAGFAGTPIRRWYPSRWSGSCALRGGMRLRLRPKSRLTAVGLRHARLRASVRSLQPVTTMRHRLCGWPHRSGANLAMLPHCQGQPHGTRPMESFVADGSPSLRGTMDGRRRTRDEGR